MLQNDDATIDDVPYKLGLVFPSIDETDSHFLVFGLLDGNAAARYLLDSRILRDLSAKACSEFSMKPFIACCMLFNLREHSTARSGRMPVRRRGNAEVTRLRVLCYRYASAAGCYTGFRGFCRIRDL